MTSAREEKFALERPPPPSTNLPPFPQLKKKTRHPYQKVRRPLRLLPLLLPGRDGRGAVLPARRVAAARPRGADRARRVQAAAGAWMHVVLRLQICVCFRLRVGAMGRPSNTQDTGSRAKQTHYHAPPPPPHHNRSGSPRRSTRAARSTPRATRCSRRSRAPSCSRRSSSTTCAPSTRRCTSCRRSSRRRGESGRGKVLVWTKQFLPSVKIRPARLHSS